MSIAVVGVNHRRAPIEVRERLAFSATELPGAVERLAVEAPEIVLLSTCNRTELYLGDAENGVDADRARRALCAIKGVEDAGIFYTFAERQAVEHLFRVTAGLDAMVLGETQIIGQVRDAYQAGRTGRVFNTLFQRALHVAGRVHSETKISQGGASVPAVAARLAERIFDSLERRRMLVVGAGEMGVLTVAAFGHRGLKDMIVANRTHERAAALGGRTIALDAIDATLPEADIVVSCIEAERPIIGADAVNRSLRTRRGDPMLLIDLGVPRNIDPAIARIENVYLFDIDDLQSIVGQTILERQSEIDSTSSIILDEAEQFMTMLNNAWVEDIIRQLRDHFHLIGQEEVAKTTDPKLKAEIEDRLRRVINKLLHSPTVELKRDFKPGTPAEIVRRMFGLK